MKRRILIILLATITLGINACGINRNTDETASNDIMVADDTKLSGDTKVSDDTETSDDTEALDDTEVSEVNVVNLSFSRHFLHQKLCHFEIKSIKTIFSTTTLTSPQNK